MYEPKCGSHSSFPSSYPTEADNYPDFSRVSKSVTLNQIKTFEKNNPRVSVNVFAVKEWKIYTKTARVKRRKLLSKSYLIDEGIESENESEDESIKEIENFREKNWTC